MSDMPYGENSVENDLESVVAGWRYIKIEHINSTLPNYTKLGDLISDLYYRL